MTHSEGELVRFLGERLVTRRQVLGFGLLMAAALALPPRIFGPRIAEALLQAKRPSLVWLEFASCTADSESFLRASRPTVPDLVFDVLSIDYAEVLMAPAGALAEKSLRDVVENQKGKYITVVEGSVPTGEDGVFCTIGGRTAVDIAREVCSKAAAVITVGACAWDGGWPSASPNPTGAKGVKDVVSGIKLINLGGCPINVVNLTATVVHYLTFGEVPATDGDGRPLFAYGDRIHDHCERRAHYDAGQFVREWGDEGHREGWCLYKMGCKGPATYHNCPAVRWNEGTSWPVGAGHGCIGCAEPHFWDRMTPFYTQAGEVSGFGIEQTADQFGLRMAQVVGGLMAAHAVGTIIRANTDRIRAAGRMIGAGVGRLRRGSSQEGDPPETSEEEWSAEDRY